MSERRQKPNPARIDGAHAAGICVDVDVGLRVIADDLINTSSPPADFFYSSRTSRDDVRTSFDFDDVRFGYSGIDDRYPLSGSE
jgi:hypothetical protein